MRSGEWTPRLLLRQTIISFVLSALRDRLLPLHQSVSCSTPSLYSDETHSCVVMMIELYFAAHSWVSGVNISGLSARPWRALAFSVLTLEVMLPFLMCRGVRVRKSRIQLKRGVQQTRLSYESLWDVIVRVRWVGNDFLTVTQGRAKSEVQLIHGWSGYPSWLCLVHGIGDCPVGLLRGHGFQTHHACWHPVWAQIEVLCFLRVCPGWGMATGQCVPHDNTHCRSIELDTTDGEIGTLMLPWYMWQVQGTCRGWWVMQSVSSLLQAPDSHGLFLHLNEEMQLFTSDVFSPEKAHFWCTVQSHKKLYSWTNPGDGGHPGLKKNMSCGWVKSCIN